jgi:gliding motility-associated lipoprotein GldH
MRSPVTLLIILIMTVSVSCQKDKGMLVVHSFPDNFWSRFEKQEFDFNVNDIRHPYDLELVVRHDDTYPFNNLYINVVIYLPDGEERIMEHDFIMKGSDRKFISQEKDGYREVVFTLRNGLRINKEGLCRVEIENLIPKTGIPGMVGLGVRMKKSND